MKNYPFKTIILIIWFLPVLISAKDLKSQAEDQIFSVLGKDINLEFEKHEIPKELRKEIEQRAKQKFMKSFVYLWQIEDNNSNSNYAVLDVIRGKSAIITVLTIFEKTGNVHSVHILKYKGEYGRAVTNEKWLSQFKGKNIESDLTIGSGIDAVSGATISANSISRGIKKWSFLIAELNKEND